MSREIKFRVWNKNTNKYEYTELDYYFVIDQRIKAYEYEQFTGLKDKNDKEIYEGDILLIPARKDKPKGNLYTVVWHKVHARFNFANKNGEFGEIQIGKIKRAEVIGNIHENPELLENKS